MGNTIAPLINPPLVSQSLRHCMSGTAADSNPLADQLINEARIPTEPAAWRDVYGELWKQVRQNLPIIYLWTFKNDLQEHRRNEARHHRLHLGARRIDPVHRSEVLAVAIGNGAAK